MSTFSQLQHPCCRRSVVLAGRRGARVAKAWVLQALLTSSTLLVASDRLDQPSLSAGRALAIELDAGERRSYAVSLAAGAWLLTADQAGVDITLSVRAAGSDFGTIDSPLDRQGVERLLFLLEEAGEIRVEVLAREEDAPSGAVTLRLDRLEGPRAKERPGLVADTEAARLYHRNDAEAWRAAIAVHQQAAEHWHLFGRPEHEARARYCRAVLLRLVGDTALALAEAQRVLPMWQALGDGHWQASTFNEIGLGHLASGSAEAARGAFDQALVLRAGDPGASARLELQQNRCVTFLSEGRRTAARDCFAPLVARIQGLTKTASAVALLVNVAGLHRVLGEPTRALALYSRALALASEQRSAARVQSGMAAALRDLGRYRDAFRQDEGALATFETLEDRRWQATTLNNLGYGLLQLGEPHRARAYLARALTLRRATDDQRGAATTLENLATSHRMTDEFMVSLRLLQEAIGLRASLGDARSQAKSERLLAELLAAAGRDDAALERLTRARALVGDQDRRERASIALAAARLALGADRPQQAKELLARALAGFRAAGDRRSEAVTRTLLARSELSLGRLEAARQQSAAAVRGLEALRDEVEGAHLRAAFLADQREVYDVQVDVLVALEAAQPDQGHGRRALETTEHSRARSLLETLRPAGRDAWRGVDPKLLGQRRRLQDQLNAKAASRLSLAATASEEDLSVLSLELASLGRQLEATDASVRRQSQRYRNLTQPALVDAPGMQAHLDADTAMVVFWLGDARSHLWWLTRDQIEHFALPARSVVEHLAMRVHTDLKTIDSGAGKVAQENEHALADMLLGALGDRLLDDLAGRQRLVVVADGALHYVPFGTLPVPGTAGHVPLLARHEVIHLPSASVLAAVRTDPGRHSGKVASDSVVVVADPVFSRRDSRLGLVTTPQDVTIPPNPQADRPRAASAPPLERLLASRREAEAIADLTPGAARLLLGFDANREQVLGGALRGHGVVHFSTHGQLDTESPELSGLVLSQFDRDGTPLDGYLRAADLYDLQLDARLVVLSSCETALGQSMRGEGLVGLATGFLAAGAPRVIASLWRVPDRATAALMTAFYRALWQDELSPAAALRQAQLAVRADHRWRDAYFWGAFVIAGDWAEIRPGETEAQLETALGQER